MTDTATSLVAICAYSGAVSYIGADESALTGLHKSITGSAQEFVLAGYDEEADFIVYRAPAAEAAEMEGDTDLDFAELYGEGTRYRVAAPVDPVQSDAALRVAIANERKASERWIDEDGDLHPALPPRAARA